MKKWVSYSWFEITRQRRTTDRLTQASALGLSETVPRVTYINLLTGSRLNTYINDIDKQVQERFERLIEDMKWAHDTRSS